MRGVRYLWEEKYLQLTETQRKACKVLSCGDTLVSRCIGIEILPVLCSCKEHKFFDDGARPQQTLSDQSDIIEDLCFADARAGSSTSQ